ncbi:hypothetical protein KR032_004498 [Drosophila birchii]|nr:hypothetical protein KR032_004498 [Drosophila birchii]
MTPRPRNAQSLESRCTRGTQSYRCRVCNGIHPLKKCRRFLRLSAEKRLRAVLVNRYCSSCLAHEHSDGACRRGDCCKTCGQDHHSLLHIVEEPRARRQPRQEEHRSRPSATTFRLSRTAPRQAASRRSSAASRQSSDAPRPSSATQRAPSTVRPPAPAAPRQAFASRQGPPQNAAAAPTLSSLLQRHSVNVLPTALVRIDTGTRIFDTGALIDPCTPSSCIDDSQGGRDMGAMTMPVSSIDRSLAAAYRLPITQAGEDEVCTATLRSRTGDFRLEFVLWLDPSLKIRTPLRALSDTIRARFNDIRLADELFHRPSTISLALESDLFPKLIQTGFLKLEDGLPFAQSTVFGWTVSGVCKEE